MRLRASIVAAVVLCWLSSAAHAVSFTLDSIPAGPLVSGNGLFQIDGIQFFSPFNTVDAGDVTLELLDDGVKLSGPLSVSGTGLQTFFVLYEVTALGIGIDQASLLLDSSVSADDIGLVLSTKGIFADGVPRPGKDKHKDEFPFDHGFDFGPDGNTALATLHTADFAIGGKGCKTPFVGLGCDGAIRLVEADFAPQQTLRIVDGVTVTAIDGEALWRSSTNTFHVVPEPTAGALTALGLMLLARRSRRSR